jgi:regulator of protease activity HflC (stomatin/prohibitin superfamily)
VRCPERHVNAAAAGSIFKEARLVKYIPQAQPPRSVFAAGAAAVVLVAVLAIFLSANTVQAGHVGVLLTWGRLSGQVLQPGFHFVVPFAQRIDRVDVRVQPHNFRQIDAASKELQTVKLTGTMNYHLQQNRVYELYQTVGLDFGSKVIDSAFSDFIKEVVPQYTVTDILAKRDEIRSKTKDKLGDNLARYGIIVDDIYLSNIEFSHDYQKAIEDKQTAQQNVEKEKQILAQKEIQAKQVIVDAQGKAQAAIETARGEAESNRVRLSTLNAELVDYIRWSKWDGKMPQVLGTSSPLLNITPR